MIRQHAPYDAVADEYYDPTRHPTCTNFRSLSKKFIEEYFDAYMKNIKTDLLIETGCGRSLICEIAEDISESIRSILTIQDQSEKMISHSVRWQNSLRDIFISDARNMPVVKSSFHHAFSFLADPYNDKGLWKEISRILTPKGHWFVTVPSHEWATRFRESQDIEVSRFVTADGAEHDLPSYTYPPHLMIRGVSKFGLTLRRFQSFNILDIEGLISDKLYVGNEETAILDCYIFQKET